MPKKVARNNQVTIVMYHYVRHIKKSPFQGIKGLEVEAFESQLRYFMKYYSIIKMQDLISSLEFGTPLANNSLLLTFDDGFADHFEYVFPILEKYGFKGSFFPPAECILHQTILDVHKIHYILAKTKNPPDLVEDIFALLDHFREDYSLESNQFYFDQLAAANRFDSKEIVLAKRLLQKTLPEELRTKLAQFLFKKIVSTDEKEFSKNLYMTIDNLQEMVKNGHFVGSHGYRHLWLNSIDFESQVREVDLSLEFLRIIDARLVDNWVMCYPYGGFNQSLVDILKTRQCSLGLATEVDIATINQEQRFSLPRLDTNDFPVNANENPNRWTAQVI